MFRTEDLVQESKGKRALHPLQERHTQCDELSSYRSIYRDLITVERSGVRNLDKHLMPLEG